MNQGTGAKHRQVHLCPVLLKVCWCTFGTFAYGLGLE